MRKVLASSAKGLILRERTGGPHRTGVMAPVTGGLRASGYIPPTGVTSSGGNPPREGGTEVGDRRSRYRDRSLQIHRGAMEEADSASGRSGGRIGFRSQVREGQESGSAAQGKDSRRERTGIVGGAVAKRPQKATEKNSNNREHSQ